MPVTQLRATKQPPNETLINSLESLLEAARMGHIRSAGLIVVNPLHEIEVTVVGDQSPLGNAVLLGGLSKLFYRLVSE